jgi:hypothetical protein
MVLDPVLLCSMGKIKGALDHGLGGLLGFGPCGLSFGGLSTGAPDLVGHKKILQT